MSAGLGRQSKVRVTISDASVSLGWWMVMSEDEQGYAPASYLEPVEESSSAQDVHPEDTTNQGGWVGLKHHVLVNCVHGRGCMCGVCELVRTRECHNINMDSTIFANQTEAATVRVLMG